MSLLPCSVQHLECVNLRRAPESCTPCLRSLQSWACTAAQMRICKAQYCWQKLVMWSAAQLVKGQHLPPAHLLPGSCKLAAAHDRSSVSEEGRLMTHTCMRFRCSRDQSCQKPQAAALQPGICAAQHDWHVGLQLWQQGRVLQLQSAPVQHGHQHRPL